MDIVKIGTEGIQDIHPQTKREIVRSGHKSLESNPFFQFVDLLMSDDNIRKYIDQFFGDWDDIKTTVMVMKTYQVVEEEIKRLEANGKLRMTAEIRRKFMIGLIKEMMTNGDCRAELVVKMNDFMGGTYKNCRTLINDRINETSPELEQQY